MEKSVQHYANIYANRASNIYEYEVESSVLEDLRSQICSIKSTGSELELDFKLATLEKQLMIRILIDAILWKTVFIPLRFPEICPKDFNFSPLLSPPGSILIKTRGIFEDECKDKPYRLDSLDFFLKAYSDDLTSQIDWVELAMADFIDDSDHLPSCEAEYTRGLVQPIVANLRAIGVTITQDGHALEQQVAAKYVYFKKFLDDLKEKLKPLEDKWNAAAAEEFIKFERVSQVTILIPREQSSFEILTPKY